MEFQKELGNTWVQPLYIGRLNHGPNSKEVAQVKAHVEMNWAGFGLGPGPNIKWASSVHPRESNLNCQTCSTETHSHCREPCAKCGPTQVPVCDACLNDVNKSTVCW